MGAVNSTLLLPGAGYQAASHGLRCCAEEVRAILKLRDFVAAQPQPGLIANPPPGAPVPPILPPKDGYLFLDRPKFAASFAADVEPETAAFMADSQVPWGVDALGGKVSEPAWKTKPSYYLVVTEDKIIPPPAQRAMAGRAMAQIVEVPGSHSIYVSNPAKVAEIIEEAANSSR